MTLREAPGSPGPPWERPLRGRVHKLVIESEVLADNPLGDPARRPLCVYVPPGLDPDARVPALYVIQGFTGQIDMWFNRAPFEASMLERVEALFADDGCPPALVVLVDAWTSYGGSQFVNSTATGRYMDYLCDEVVPFVDDRWPTLDDRDHRGIAGKSSGGYGAMVVAMMRPDVFSAFATHAGDALFEACYLPDFREAARSLRDHFDGSYETFWKAVRTAESFDWEKFGAPMNAYAMAACYSPDEATPTEPALPFDIATGRLVPEVWERWLAWDPVRMAPERADALTSMRRIYVDAGNKDEYFLDLGAQAFCAELDKLGVDYTFDLFDGTHMNLQYRYPGALEELAVALTS
jgi:S-formylglutathione hydrolase FrmB